MWARLRQATAGPTAKPTWKLGFVYDRYGNRTQQNVLAGTGFATQTPTDPVTNRLASPNTYDASGNLTYDTVHSFTYDAENRIKTVDGGATATYTYDAGPLRVKKVQGSTTTVYIYSGSKEIARYANGALNAEYVYVGGKLLAAVLPNGFRYYAHPDHLSNRVLTDPSGGVQWTAGNYPYGESWYQPVGNTDQRFTSYVRDFASGLDYATFRDYSSRLGRFAQVDPLAGDVGDPQSTNRYAYTRNDPVNFVDPLGLDFNQTWDNGCIAHFVTYTETDSHGNIKVRVQLDSVTCPPGTGGGGRSGDGRERWRRVFSCAARLSSSVSIGNGLGYTPNNSAVAKALGGNDFATVTNLLQGDIASAGDLAVSNPTDWNAIGLAGRAVGNLPVGAPYSSVRVTATGLDAGGEPLTAAALNRTIKIKFTIVPKRATIAGTVFGKTAARAFAYYSAVKLGFDAITYGVALGVCVSDER